MMQVSLPEQELSCLTLAFQFTDLYHVNLEEFLSQARALPGRPMASKMDGPQHPGKCAR